MLTSIQEQDQQLNHQDPDTIDDSNVEALLFNYLQAQQHPPEPEPESVTTLLPVDLFSSELFGLPLSNYSAASTPSSSCSSIITNSPFGTNINLFQSPQMPYLNQIDRQSESSTSTPNFYGSPLLSTLTNDRQQQQLQQQQQNLMLPDGSWGHSLLDLFQASVNFDGSNNNNSSNNSIGRTTITSPSSDMDSSAKQSNSNTKNIQLEVNSYTDLKNVLESMQNQIGAHFFGDDLHTMQQHRRKRRKRRRSNITDLEQQQERRQVAAMTASMNSLPMAVRDTVDTASLLPLLMEKAQKHWCCVGFKVAPLSLDMVRHWQQAPITIVYSVAAIVLVTIMDHNAGQAYVKAAAMVFYEQARRKLDDVVFDDEDDSSNYYFDGHGDNDGDDDDGTGDRKKAMTIQSYFCLSYTSNLLRLYDQQRTWGCLASIALQLRTKDMETGCRPLDEAILLCYCRWYYVDAWMALTLQRECLLSETPPRFILDIIQRTTENSTATLEMDTSRTQNIPPPTTLALPQEHQSLYHFAILAKFMRRFIRILRSNKLMDPVTLKPSSSYYAITSELQQWYHTVQQQQKTVAATAATTMVGPRSLDSNNQISGGYDDDPGGGVHLHLCYNAMRLVILYKFLHPDILEPDDTIFKDGLETNLAILQSLQQLVLQGCDQSTYHYMFFAIHSTSSRIYQYHNKNRNSTWQRLAKEQLQMNLVLLKGTQAYINDVFQMREHAEKIEAQFRHMGLVLSRFYRTTLASMEKQQQLLLQQQQTLERNWMDTFTTSTADTSALQKESFLPPTPPSTTTSAISPVVEAATSISKTNSSCASIPGMHIYKLHTTATIKKPRNSNKQTKKSNTIARLL